MKLVQLNKVRPVFRNGYERMAYIALEVLTKNQTEVQLAALLGMSSQRVSQIYIAALARVGCTHNPDPAEVGFRFRKFMGTDPSDPDHIENFTKRELTFRGKYIPGWMN